MEWRLRPRDLQFMVETLMPQIGDIERASDRVGTDAQSIEAMLDDNRLFQRLLNSDDILLHVSPWLFFVVLLRRAQRDLEQEAYTVEKRHRQKVLLFDTDRVIQLLEQQPVQDYLATMLSSFTRVESITVPVRVRPGVWQKYKVNDLDVDSMMRYCQTTDEPFRFEPYRRIADACLFLAGMFTEYVQGRYRYPLTNQIRPHARGRPCASLEDYEAHGQAFYRLAAEHEMARMEGLEGVLTALSDNFILAEKPLSFLSSRYLSFAKHRLFETHW